MKKNKFFTAGLIAITFGCSNPNSDYIETIKKQVNKDAMGVQLNYKSLEFQWIDTLYVNEEVKRLNDQLSDGLKTITEIEFFVKDNFEKGKIFSKNYLTKERLTEIRNFQNDVRESMYPSDGYKNYYDWLLEEKNCDSEWCKRLRKEIIFLDSVIQNFENFYHSDLNFLKAICWHYKYIDSYYSNKNPDPIWEKIEAEIIDLSIVKSSLDSLAILEPEKVIYYKALNTYKINNPIFNGAEQEIKRYFFFNSNKEIIGREEFEE